MKVAEDIKQQAIQKYRDGENVDLIGSALGITRWDLYKCLEGIPKRRRTFTSEEERTKARRLQWKLCDAKPERKAKKRLRDSSPETKAKRKVQRTTTLPGIVARKWAELNEGARTRDLDVNIPREHFSNLIQQPCYYCGRAPDGLLLNGIDRYNNRDRQANNAPRFWSGVDYVLENCVACCWDCNSRKKALEGDLFIEHQRRNGRLPDNAPCLQKEKAPFNR